MYPDTRSSHPISYCTRTIHCRCSNLYRDAPNDQPNLYPDDKNHAPDPPDKSGFSGQAILALCFLPGIRPTEFLPALLRLSGFAVRRGQMGK